MTYLLFPARISRARGGTTISGAGDPQPNQNEPVGSKRNFILGLGEVG